MSTLKDNWKKIGDEFTTFGKDLGKTIAKTVKSGAKAISDWADRDDESKDAPPEADIVIEPEQKKE